MKVCTKCKELKSLEAFHKGKHTTDGRQSFCKDCNRTYQREWRRANSEKSNAYSKRWRDNNKEHQRQYDAKRHDALREEYREYARRWYYENRERALATSEAWRTANPEKVKEQGKRRWANNPESMRIHSRKRRARKLSGISEPYTRLELLEAQGYKCYICSADLEDDGRKTHIDHVLPLSSGFAYDVPLNVRAACAPCNIRKNDNITVASLEVAFLLAMTYEDDDLTEHMTAVYHCLKESS